MPDAKQDRHESLVKFEFGARSKYSLLSYLLLSDEKAFDWIFIKLDSHLRVLLLTCPREIKCPYSTFST